MRQLIKYTPIAIKVGGKTYGIIYGDILRKTVKASKHFLHKPAAICLDSDALDRAVAAGATRIEVVDTETGTTYSQTIAHVKRAGFVIDRGWGLQLALVLSAWQVHKRGEPTQLALFGGGI
jgi:hypothetical protein